MQINPIAPHALTAATMPAEGAMIGYTGKAFWGEDFLEHGYVSFPILVTEQTDGSTPGFYGLVATDEDEPNYPVFVMLDDGRQTLHGGRW